MGLIKPDTDDRDPEDEQFKRQQQLQGLSAALEEDGVDGDFIDRITSTDLELETIQLLDNLLSSDWVLANFNAAEVHETRWLVRVMKLQLETLHPPEDSIWQGEYRKYAAGEERQALKSLDSAQRLEIAEVIQGVVSRATRAKEGWQQENFNKTHRVSETVDRNEDEDSGWLG